MKDDLFNITLDNLSGSLMLTVEPKEDMVINTFCCEMIKKTNVYGLLKLNVTTFDGKIKFNYDLSKKKSISEYAKTGFSEYYGRRILYNLCIAFLKLNEYYLKPGYCLLNPEYTYIGDGLNVYLPYIPAKDISFKSDELKMYFAELLSKYFAVEGVSAYDEMFKYVYQCQTLDLEHFIGKFLSSEEQSHDNFIAEKQEKLANKMPLPNKEPIKPIQPIQVAQPQLNNNKVIQNNNNSNINGNAKQNVKIPEGGGIKIPGGGEMKISDKGLVNPSGLAGNKNYGNSDKNIEKKGIFGFGGKNEPNGMNRQQEIKMPNRNMGQNNLQQFAKPQNNFQNFPKQNNNIQPVFNNNFQINQNNQSNMNRTIMINEDMPQMQDINNKNGMAYLKYRGQRVPISDSEFVIGKANNQYKVNFVINDNPHVSRKHATILVQGNNYFIRDEGSTNGTYVNGRFLPKMMPQPLNNGDEISIYDEVFIFCK